ncbi:MAG: GNAT family N-acetyltransferase [Spirochaetales bacterium]|nr:GNAT family N-acetyltransferase [Spirochaetales bacterium]
MFSFWEKNNNPSGWSRAVSREFDSIISFLSPREHSCISITSRLMQNGRPDPNLLKHHEVYLEKKDGKIVSLLLLSTDSVIAPFFTTGSSDYIPEELLKKSPLMRKRYLTFMGMKEDVLRLELLFGNRSKLSVDYFQLSAESALIPAVVKQYLKSKKNNTIELSLIKKAEISDFNLLMPLRKAYEIEEVLLVKSNFNEQASRNRFRKTILEKAVFFGTVQNKPAATCCINTEGIAWYQIGGVFTRPEYRSKGISARLMAELAVYAGNFGKNLTLFVKKDNLPALKLYSNCGFSTAGEFRITYAERR